LKADDARRKRTVEQYRAKINPAVDYIESNLDEDFTLEAIASIAGFSKYHFHRIFYTFTGDWIIHSFC